MEVVEHGNAAPIATVIEAGVEAARELTDRIKAGLDHLADSYEAVLPMITEAFETEVWTRIGYRRNGASQWIEDNFSGAVGRLSVGLRREIAVRLRDEIPGISSRGIAALAGVDPSTIAADLRPALEQKPEGNPSRFRGPYAAELADPEGWRTITERIEARPKTTTIAIPGDVIDAARQLMSSGIECDATVASEVGAVCFAALDIEQDAVTAEAAEVVGDADTYRQWCERAGVDLALYVWTTSTRTFTGWPVLQRFWRFAHDEKWFDVRAFVEQRVSGAPVSRDYPYVPEDRLYDCDDDRPWTLGRAAAVLGLLDRDGDRSDGGQHEGGAR